ncbi:kinase-like domain-containing protein [Gautieria morchelliformis]|nr:kinase-like domain-containing protein [Gautieria morchelliformis]
MDRPYFHADGTEYPGRYRYGGYHPVHLDDIFQDRYRVVAKLGSGSYSTVWLVDDLHSRRWVSLKILTADAPNAVSEVELSRYLRKQPADGKDSDADYVVTYFDDFKINGPNGTHHCIVAEFLGPNLATDLFRYDIYEDEGCRYPTALAKKMSIQVARGLAYLHRHGIIHGDLHPGNLLLFVKGMDHWSPQKLKECLGEPQKFRPIASDGTPRPFTGPHGPRYLLDPPNPTKILDFCLNSPDGVHVKIGDFSEAFWWENEPKMVELHTPHVYAAPEILFNDRICPASDIWALGNAIYSIFTGGCTIFQRSMFGSRQKVDNRILLGMFHLLGKFPPRWWTRWNDRSEYLDGDGKFLPGKEGKAIGIRLRLPGETIEQEEKIMLDKLETTLRMMLRYEPNDRISARKAVELLQDCFDM